MKKLLKSQKEHRRNARQKIELANRIQNHLKIRSDTEYYISVLWALLMTFPNMEGRLETQISLSTANVSLFHHSFDLNGKNLKI